MSSITIICVSDSNGMLAARRARTLVVDSTTSYIQLIRF